jgi:hypothetical protein
VLLESSFFFCTQQVTKRLHSGEVATAREDGVTRTVIKSLRGWRGGRQLVFAAPSLGGAAREQDAAMEAGGGAVAAPQNRGSSPTGQPQAAAAENMSGPFGNDFFFFFFLPPIKRGVSPQKRARAADTKRVGPGLTARGMRFQRKTR